MQELKIALLGKVSSGKTSLAIRFISNVFSCQGQYKAVSKTPHIIYMIIGIIGIE